jgi:hypothetical protein
MRQFASCWHSHEFAALVLTLNGFSTEIFLINRLIVQSEMFGFDPSEYGTVILSAEEERGVS